MWGEEKHSLTYTFPGEAGGFQAHLADLPRNGYNGCFYNEPRLRWCSAILPSATRFNNYLEYGKRLEKMQDEPGLNSFV